MSDGRSFSGRFFDGESAAAQTLTVVLGDDAVIIELAPRRISWAYSNLALAYGPAHEIRLSEREHADAMLILPSSARPALQQSAPELFARTQARRQFTLLVAALIGGAAIVAAVLFIGVPAASGPLAKATPKSFETRIGGNMAAQITVVFRTCKGDATDDALAEIRPIIDDIALNADVGFPIVFQFVNTPAPNAFALPGGQVMATAGLLEALGDDQEAFLAVVAHELGHVRARDGLRAFYRNAGLGVALEIITGGSGAAQQAVLLGGQITQLRFTRMQEKAADETAFEILEQANLDPGALARAFEKIEAHVYARQDDDDDDMPSWLKTHPNTEERIENARAHKREGAEPPLSAAAWQKVISACS